MPDKEALASQLCKFIDASPTPFHLVNTTIAELHKAGFVELDETTAWATLVKPGGRYYYTRNGSTLVAFTVGAAYEPGGGSVYLLFA